jgi:hypothetical protein
MCYYTLVKVLLGEIVTHLICVLICDVTIV